jgi:hypothetical protein
MKERYHLYTDRSYTNMNLAWRLLTGTVLQKREGMPRQMEINAFQLGEHVVVAYRKQDKYLILA